jgi:hypothetical protein
MMHRYSWDHLKAAIDRELRVEIWNTLEKRGISEKLLRVIKSTYEKVEEVIRLDGKESENLRNGDGSKIRRQSEPAAIHNNDGRNT